MRSAVSRAELIRGRMTPAPEAQRPPYSLPENAFLDRCDCCTKCVDVCPTDVIGRDGSGYPILLFGQSSCTFCSACAEACPTGALSLDQAGRWHVTAHIKGTCLSFNGITCRACDERCDEAAIRFRLMTQGRALPLVDETRCTGCGACAVICPNNSIDMRVFRNHEVRRQAVRECAHFTRSSACRRLSRQ